jgi:uncharacterized membrane-anchored protein YitT (DUF2179 family)
MIIATILAFVIAFLPTDTFGIEGLNAVQQRVIAIFVFAAIMWLTEAIPSWCTSVLIIVVMLFTISDKGLTPFMGVEDAIYVPYKNIMHCFADPTILLFIGGFVIDAVVDGPRTARVAYVISDRHAQIANEILYEMGRGCTELQARGVWSGSSRPMLMCAVGRTETARLKEIVARVDPDAIMIVSNVHEAFGEGFGQFGRNGL